MKNGYDNVAFFYDSLSRLVFGRRLLQAQASALHAVMPADHILIAGGGSGHILAEIARLHPRGLTITYIDASTKMIALAQQQNRADNKVNFIAARVESVQLGSDYDVVITPFFFDNFRQEEAAHIFAHLHAALNNNGHWLYTDFQNSTSALHRFTLKLMYRFFGMLCGIGAHRLPDMETCFAGHGYTLQNKLEIMNGFVAARTYVKR